jgi:hypothetical protein
VFPFISLLTLVISLIEQKRSGKYSSPIFIPLFGPITLTCWILTTEKSPWFIPLVWISDIGTMAFLYVIPRLLIEWWETSVFTRIISLNGKKDIQTAVLSLHRGGHYLLKKSWRRENGQCGIVGLGEPGTFQQNEADEYKLLSDHGTRRKIKKDNDIYLVTAELFPNENMDNYSIIGWELKTTG